MIFTDLSTEDRRDAIDYTSAKTGYTRQIVEKDWWVTAVLRAIFSLPYSDSLSFKGGTNLSKCWNLISRMSEDADIGVSRDFLGFGGDLTKTQISDKLRRAACTFVRTTLKTDVESALHEQGIKPENIKVWVNETKVSTVDPEVIYVGYQPLFEANEYVMPQVKIEVSGRSMTEPLTKVSIQSYIVESLPVLTFDEFPVELNAVIPQRTFLEKLFLLHEEFAKPSSEIRIERMSRHLYDVVRIMGTSIAEEALADNVLYNSVIEHRRRFIGLKGFDYNTLNKSTLNIIPQGEVRKQWEADYNHTLRNMIIGDAPTFDEVIEQLTLLNKKINESVD